MKRLHICLPHKSASPRESACFLYFTRQRVTLGRVDCTTLRSELSFCSGIDHGEQLDSQRGHHSNLHKCRLLVPCSRACSKVGILRDPQPPAPPCPSLPIPSRQASTAFLHTRASSPVTRNARGGEQSGIFQAWLRGLLKAPNLQFQL